MSYYNYEFLGIQDGWHLYICTPNFTPRKAGQNFEDMLSAGTTGNANQEKPSIHDLSPEQKEEMRAKLHNGRGNLSLQEWDDFLADLVDLGIITNDERMYANGILCDMPESVLKGNGYRSNGRDDTTSLDDLWNGDPQRWLNELDVYMLKNALYSNMGCISQIGLSSQRSAIITVSDILKEILN